MQYPLCVDLDGTLIKTDTLFESLVVLLKSQPLRFLLVFIWILRGRPYLKQRVAALVQLPVATLPYNTEFLAWLRQEHQQGRTLVLVTASDQHVADQVATHVGLFAVVKGSDGHTNLKSRKKRDYLVEQFGERQYDYAGDSRADIAVWQSAHAAILVGASAHVAAVCHKVATVAQEFPKPGLSIKGFLKAIRVHQYAKNCLIFVPLLLSPLIMQPSKIMVALVAFICFSIMASSVYLLNDLFDLESDRKHARKSKRAIAAGDLSIAVAGALVIGFLLLSIIIAAFLPLNFFIVLVIYYLLTLAYSFYLKRVALIDVFTLSALYTLRILAGMTVLDVGFSNWLVIFSLFFFTSLAFVKRYTELSDLQNAGMEVVHGRGYHVDHLLMITIFGIVSGYLSILVFALYISSEKAVLLYHQVNSLYLICPILLYWISRIWLKASVGMLHEDPIVFAIKDKVSYLMAAMAAVIVIFAALNG